MSANINSNTTSFLETHSLDDDHEAKRARIASSHERKEPFEVAQHAIANSANSETSYTFPKISLNFFNIFLSKFIMSAPSCRFPQLG